MKNKIMFLGSLCLILALGLVFTGCKNEVQKVEYASIGAPKNVQASYDTTNSRLEVTWDAVKDANGYQVVLTQKSAKTFMTLSTTSSIGPIYGDGSAIPDLDKWRARVGSSNLPKGEFKVGVIATSRKNATNASSPGWAPDLVTIP